MTVRAARTILVSKDYMKGARVCCLNKRINQLQGVGKLCISSESEYTVMCEGEKTIAGEEYADEAERGGMGLR